MCTVICLWGTKYFRTKNLFDEWEDMGDPCVGDVNHTTFNSQTTNIFKVDGKDMYFAKTRI